MFQNQFHQPNFSPNNFNPMQHMQEFIGFVKDFQNTSNQQNPKMIVNQLLQSGRMSQQVYNTIYPIANTFFSVFSKFQNLIK